MTLPVDPFAPETDGYEREKFYITATDARGHSKSVRTGLGEDLEVVSVKPHIAAGIGALRAQIPLYRTNQDFVRDSILHNMNYRAQQFRAELPLEVLVDVERVTVLAEIQRRIRVRQQHELLVQHIDEELKNRRSDYDVESLAERAAMCMEIPSFIRQVRESLNHYRR